MGWPSVRSRWLVIGQVLFLRVLWTRKKGRPMSSNLVQTNLVNKGFIIWSTISFSCGTQWVIPSGQESAILAARVANHNVGMGSAKTKNVISRQFLLMRNEPVRTDANGAKHWKSENSFFDSFRYTTLYEFVSETTVLKGRRSALSSSSSGQG